MDLRPSSTKEKSLAFICRLCISFTECPNSINNITFLLEDLHFNLDLTLTTNPVICPKCINSVTTSYNFKIFCMNKERQIRDHYEKTKSTVDLHTLVEIRRSCDAISNVPNNFKYDCENADMIKIEEAELSLIEEQQRFDYNTTLDVKRISQDLKNMQNISNIEKTEHKTRTELQENHVTIGQFDLPLDSKLCDDKFNTDNIVEIVESDIESDAGPSLSGDEEFAFKEFCCNKFGSKDSSNLKSNCQNLLAIANSYGQVSNKITTNDYVEIVDSDSETQDSDMIFIEECKKDIPNPNALCRDKALTETVLASEQVQIDYSHKTLQSDPHLWVLSNEKCSEANDMKILGPLYRRLSTNQYSCVLCGKTFTQKLNLDGHLLTKHKTIPNIEQRVQSKIHYCQYCSYRTINNHNLDQHVVSKHSKKSESKEQFREFYCTVCKYFTKNKENFTIHSRKHMKRVNKNIPSPLYRRISTNQYSCVLCDKTFTQKLHLDGHLLTKHKTIPNIEERVQSKIHYCQYCLYRTINNYNLSKHVASRHNSQNKRKFRKFYCADCEYSTENKGNLIIHSRKHKTVKDFPCYFCKQTSFAQKNNLEKHILRIHAKEILFKSQKTN